MAAPRAVFSNDLYVSKQLFDVWPPRNNILLELFLESIWLSAPNSFCISRQLWRNAANNFTLDLIFPNLITCDSRLSDVLIDKSELSPAGDSLKLVNEFTI